MSAERWILNLWPGLPQLWRCGTWRSLSLAVAFTALLNCALVATFVEDVSWPPWLQVGLWIGVCGFVLGACLARMFDPSAVVSREAVRQGERLFCEAQIHYLKGHWYESEKRLRELLASNNDDNEARLLLVSVLRSNGRGEEAQRELASLAKSFAAAKWELEIEQEQIKLAKASKSKRVTAEEPVETLPFPQKAA